MIPLLFEDFRIFLRIPSWRFSPGFFHHSSSSYTFDLPTQKQRDGFRWRLLRFAVMLMYLSIPKLVGHLPTYRGEQDF